MRSMAVFHSDNRAALASGKPAARRPMFGAINTLRLLLVGTIVVPLLLTVIGGYFSYRTSYQTAAAALTEAVAVAEENTTKILDTHMLVAARIDDLLAGLTDAQIQAEQYQLHERIAHQIADLPQVAAAWVIDASGHELVSARVYPVNRDLDQSARDDFRALKDSRTQTFIWALRARSLDRGDYQPYFTVSRRRQGADGSFQGIIVVAVSGQYFASFYNSLLGASAEYQASVLRDDGTVLAGYPETAAPAAPAQGDEPLARAIAARQTSGIIATGSPFGDKGSLVAYQRLANYPVYVTIGRTRASILQEWLATMGGYAAIGVPAAIGLMLLSLLALRRTRREQRALAQARDALAERAAIEDQLHHAHKMEAVGLLTAGIAHDFNNLLTIVSGNIALLEADREAIDPKHRRFISAAMSGCEKASALTKRLLSFAGREPVDPRPVDVTEVVTRMSDLPWRSLGDRVATELRQRDDLWPVFVDPGQLENALLNLALNARDAMAGRGRLTIETANLRLDEPHAAGHPGVGEGEYVTVFVSDTGCGMPREVLAKAFDPFFTTKGAGKGTGLGLSQVYGFVTRSGGHCAIDSEPGRGTTVKLYLPRYRGAPARASAADEARSADPPDDGPAGQLRPTIEDAGAAADSDAPDRTARH
jgi:signal transduction histidine kinase